jgi:hypothetical protein
MMDKTYRDQKKQRLSDVVFDYLSDEETMTVFLSDLKEIVKSTFDYHKTYSNGCKKVLDELSMKSQHSKYYYDVDLNRNINTASKKDWDDFWEGW